MDILHNVLVGFSDILNLYGELEANVNAIKRNPKMVEGMNLISNVTVFQLEDIHRELVIQRDMLPLHLRRGTTQNLSGYFRKA